MRSSSHPVVWTPTRPQAHHSIDLRRVASFRYSFSDLPTLTVSYRRRLQTLLSHAEVVPPSPLPPPAQGLGHAGDPSIGGENLANVVRVGVEANVERVAVYGRSSDV